MSRKLEARNSLAVEIGARIKSAWDRKGYTQPKIADLMGLSRSVFAQCETGRSMPTPQHLLKLEEPLDVSVRWLIKGDCDADLEEKRRMDDIWALGARAGAMLKARGERCAVAETSAGGLICASLLAVPGASAYFVGGAVTYSKRSIRALAGISIEDMRALGVRSSSEPYAQMLATAIRAKHGDLDWGLSETGAAGPNGNSYGDPSGHTCLAVAGPINLVRTVRTGEEDRRKNMFAFAVAALALFIEALESSPK